MKKQALLLFILIMSATSLVLAQNRDNTQTETANFSGVWQFEKISNNTILMLDKYTFWNEQKVRKISIKHEEINFLVRVLDDFDDAILEMKFLTNGKGETNTSPFRVYDKEKDRIFSEYLTFKSSTKQDGRTVTSKAVIDVKLDGGIIPITRIAEWKLSKDGKELVEKISLSKFDGGAASEHQSNSRSNIIFTRKYKLVE